MADLIPSSSNPPPAGTAPSTPLAGEGSVLSLLTAAGGGSASQRLRALSGQPAVRRSLPAIAMLGAVTGAGLLWLALSEPPQRTLYGSLSDAEKAGVAASLDAAGIGYTIDHGTGALSVAEDDLYRARMMVASDGALAAPDSATDLLGSIPLGASRMVEGERVRHARERELMLTVMEIDGVEAVRVHLAVPERSVFIRDQAAPSASVMVRLARGRGLAPAQVAAIADLVAASVPGMTADAVRIADQNGHLLSRKTGEGANGLELQTAFENKLRAQIAQLLLPILGEGNFSTEVQVELDLAEVTRARESYDKDGVLRSESQAQSQQVDPAPAIGMPGALSNVPPPAAQIDPAAPLGTGANGAGATSGESSARRTFELGRQVSVSTNGPGGVRRISVAVALSAAALKQVKPASVQQIEQLVATAVGADPARGDKVTVIASAFDPDTLEAAPFYDSAWFPAALRGGTALLALVLALLFVVRPLLKTMRRSRGEGNDGEPTGGDGDAALASRGVEAHGNAPSQPAQGLGVPEEVLLVRTLAAERPEQAATTLRRMLAAPAEQRA